MSQFSISLMSLSTITPDSHISIVMGSLSIPHSMLQISYSPSYHLTDMHCHKAMCCPSRQMPKQLLWALLAFRMPDAEQLCLCVLHQSQGRAHNQALFHTMRC